MRDRKVYRKVYTRLWRHQKFQSLSDGEKVLALYLVSGPQTNQIGCYHFSVGLACEDLGISPAQLKKRLATVLAAFDWRHDDALRMLWIPTWLAWNPPNGQNSLKSWQAEVESLPDSDAKRWLTDGIGMPSPRQPDGIRTQDQEQEQEAGSGTGAGWRPPEPALIDGRGEWFWGEWCRELRQTSGVRLSLQPKVHEGKQVAEIIDKVPDDERLAFALHRFMTLNPEQAKSFNVKAKSLGYFSMALPKLLEMQAPAGTSARTAGNVEAIRRFVENAK